MNVLIVCQAGAGVGLGHLSRSLVVGKALAKEFGANVRFLIQGESYHRADLDSFPHTFLDSNENLAYVLCSLKDIGIVILDLKFQTLQEDSLLFAIRILRSSGAKVVVIDGLLQWRNDLDLIFIPSFQVDATAFPSSGAPVVFGWDCFLIDDAVKNTEWLPGRKILVLSGGSDSTQLGNTWPSLLNESLPSGSELEWVTGPFAQNPRWPKKQRIKMTQHAAPNGLQQLMRETNYAVTVFGVSFFELLYQGIPTVVFSPYGNKDSEQLMKISEDGVALVAADEIDATKRLCNLMRDHKSARQLSEKAKILLHKSGAERICSEIFKLLD